MRILISNDDGYFAPGIIALARVMSELGQVTVVAPERDRSGASNSLTLDRPLMARQAPGGFFFVDGTPTDCVHLAVTGLLDHVPDVVVSGVNAGSNMGDDTIYSGTVAAATEGYLLGIPAIAVSLASKTGTHFEVAARVALDLGATGSRRRRRRVRHCSTSTRRDLPYERLGAPRGGATGPAAQGRAGDPHQQPARRGRCTGCGAAGAAADAGPGTDFFAVEQGRVAITPLQLDLTHTGQLAAVRRAWPGRLR
jgi:5'-nucleotidase